MIHRYAVFGLRIASEIALPDLAPDEDGHADLIIRTGVLETDEQRPGYHPHGDAALLVVPGTARFRIVTGTDMLVEAAPGAVARDVRLFVLGSAMGAVLHQRGLLPLHANAVGIAGGSIALLGHSGAGKSTLARWFHDRGYPVLSDDVCVVGADGLVAPGIPRLRLWRDALEASGRSVADHEQSYEGADKFDVPIAATSTAMPLRAVYLLGRGEPGIARLAGARAVAALVGNTYRGGYLTATGRTGAHLAACLALAQRVPVFAFDRSWVPDRYEAEAEMLVEHARALP